MSYAKNIKLLVYVIILKFQEVVIMLGKIWVNLCTKLR
ncbi:hypothetical protein M20_0677 [Lactococcus lactis subsp. lactis]|uniref:Uncharacterized protein n=1 Tax=Lactococcus lactis subsp. lactis TaxID=1360 RepID=A0A0V8E8R0_LACLL|nr:hypothetical protein M20_0677 [Lactococcus lactis subsp. lactis]